MNRILCVVLLAGVGLLKASAAEGDAGFGGGIKPGIWREQLQPGETDYIWSLKENLPQKKGFSLIDSDGKSYPLAASKWGLAEDYTDGASLALPATMQPGMYSLSINDRDTGVKVSVVLPPPSRPSVQLSPSGGTDSARIQSALDSGNDVLLSPGVYLIDKTIHRPAGATIRGIHRDHVTLVRQHNADDYRDSLFSGSGGDFGGITDVTLDGTEAPGAILYHCDALEHNLVFRNLRLIRACGPLCNAPGVLYENIEFLESGIMAVSGHAMFHEISFAGKAVEGHELLIGGDQNAVINGTWDRTSRGIVLRTNGPTNSYFNSLDFERINQGINTNEVLLAEDSPSSVGLQGCLFTYIQIHECRGRAIAMDAPASNNTFRCFDVEGGEGIGLDGDAPQTANLFQSFEMRRCWHIYLGNAKQPVTGNTFDQIAIIDPTPSWCNQYWFSLSRFPLTDQVIRGAAGNRFTKNFRIFGMPQGWTTGLEDIPR